MKISLKKDNDETYYLGYEDAIEDVKKSGWLKGWNGEIECNDDYPPKKEVSPCKACKKEMKEELEQKEEELQADIDKREKSIAKREAQLKKAQEEVKPEQAKLEEERKRLESERRMLNEEIIEGSDIAEVL